MVMPGLAGLGLISCKIVEHIKHQKDAQRNSVQKEVLNSSPSFFSASLVKKTLTRITTQDRDFATGGGGGRPDVRIASYRIVPGPHLDSHSIGSEIRFLKSNRIVSDRIGQLMVKLKSHRIASPIQEK